MDDKKMRAISASSHSSFFCSLKQVEKRLKVEQSTSPQETESLPRGSMNSSLSCSAMLLNEDQSSGSIDGGAPDSSSDAPPAFHSIPQGFTPTPQPQQPSHTTPSDQPATVNDDDDDDDIERLMQLLCLSDEQRDDFDEDVNSCHCEDGFYSKIVGVEGPKCRKEVQRLEGWIEHFLNGGKKEPLRLAHLLLGKAAFISKGADAGFGGLDFPSTIQEFLHNDPPSN